MLIALNWETFLIETRLDLESGFNYLIIEIIISIHLNKILLIFSLIHSVKEEEKSLIKLCRCELFL